MGRTFFADIAGISQDMQVHLKSAEEHANICNYDKTLRSMEEARSYLEVISLQGDQPQVVSQLSKNLDETRKRIVTQFTNNCGCK